MTRRGNPFSSDDPQSFWRLSGEELGQLQALARDADRVQLKMIVPESAHDATCAALRIDFAQARARRVYFLDTPDLALDRHGIVVRVRSIDRKPDDSVVKLRPLVPRGLPAALRCSKRFVVEIDGMPGGYVCSGALKAQLGPHAVERAVTGERRLSALFSKRQSALLAGRGPAGLAIDDLTAFGPIDARERRIVPDGLGRVLTGERWAFPDGSQILELSARSAADQALPAAARMAAVLQAHGVEPADPQRTKTCAALDFFSGRGSAATGLEGGRAAA